MKACLRYFLLLGCLPPCAGCLAHQVARDGKNFHAAVEEMYTDQIMNNLVRARCNLPFIQLAYSNLLVQDTDTASGMAEVDQTIDARRGGTPFSVVRDLTNKYMLGGTARRDRVMSFHADPITNQNDVYEAYVAFANDPNLFIASDQPPPGPVHIMRKCDKKYYWVPCEAGPAFMGLVLKTTLLRGPEAPVSPAYPVEIAAVHAGTLLKDKDRDLLNITLEFNNPVPNGEANLVAKLGDGRQVRLELRGMYRTDKGALDEGESTKQLQAQVSPSDKFGPKAHDLVGAQGQVYSYRFPRLVPTPPPPILQQIYQEIDRIRANQHLSP